MPVFRAAGPERGPLLSSHDHRASGLSPFALGRALAEGVPTTRAFYVVKSHTEGFPPRRTGGSDLQPPSDLTLARRECQSVQEVPGGQVPVHGASFQLPDRYSAQVRDAREEFHGGVVISDGSCHSRILRHPNLLAFGTRSASHYSGELLGVPNRLLGHHAVRLPHLHRPKEVLAELARRGEHGGGGPFRVHGGGTCAAEHEARGHGHGRGGLGGHGSSSCKGGSLSVPRWHTHPHRIGPGGLLTTTSKNNNISTFTCIRHLINGARKARLPLH